MRILAFGCACLLISFVRLTDDSYGQPDLRNKKDVYNYWAQRGIIELVYSSMEDYPKELTKEELNGKQKYFDEFINGIEEKDITEISRDFNYVEEFLTSNSYKVTANNYFRPLKEAFEQKKSLDSEFFMVSNYYVTSTSWYKKKEELLLAYSQSMQNVNHNTSNSKTERNTSISLPEQSSKNTLPLKWILLSFIVGIIIGAYSIYLCFRSKIYSILRKEKHEYLDKLKQNLEKRTFPKKSLKIIGIIEVLKQSKDQKKEDLDKCKKEIGKLKRENSDLNKEKRKSEENVQFVSDKNKDSLIERTIDQNEKLIVINKESIELFFTIPDRDGSFKTLNARYNKEKDCFYKISVDSSGQSGKLHFISGEYDMRALENIDYYMNPACEIQNITDRFYARRIEMINPGTVIKMGDIWRIEKNNKVKVKLV